MPALDQVINVQVSASTAAVAQASFGIPLIVGVTNPGWTGTDFVHAYSSAAAMLTDGYNSSSPEYIAALALMAQPISPTQFLVARRTNPAVAEVGTLTITGAVTTGHTYNVNLDAAAYGFSGGGYTAQAGDTALQVLTGLLAALTGGLVPFTGAITGTGASAVLTYTAKIAGNDIKFAPGTDPAIVRTITTPASSFSSDIAKARAQNDTWYGLVYAGATDAQILEVAAWTEAQKKIFFAASSTSAIATSATTDAFSTLKTAAYKRTVPIYSVAGIGQGIEAAWLGGQLPQTPGSNNWAFKTLNGIAADSLTDTQRAILAGNPVAGIAGKNANIYTPLGGLNVMQYGTTASGQYVDITVGIDWLQLTIQSYVYRVLATSPTKIPYTDAGASVLMQAVRQALDEGIANGLIAPDAVTLTAPRVLTVSANQRAQRIAPTISFGCRLQGAFNSVTVSGVVTV